MPNPPEPAATPSDLPEPASPAPEAAAPGFPADGGERPLAPAWTTVARLSSLVWGAVFSAIAAVGLTIGVVASETLTLAAGAMVFVLLSSLFLLPAFLWPPISYRHRTYRFTPEGVHLRRGVFWRSQIAVSRSRVQHTDVSQNPFERIYGLGTLTVHTAGNHYAAISLPGLEYAEALAARDFLLAAPAAEAFDAV